MPSPSKLKPKKHKLPLGKRREKACELFAKGYTNADVKKELGVGNDAVAGYRKYYNERIHVQAAANPEIISDVLANTLRVLEEVEQVRANAWQHLNDRKVLHDDTCPECGEGITLKITMPVADQTRAQYLNVILKALDSRAKLFGIIGVKAEMFVQIERTQYVQGRIIEWLLENLGQTDRDNLTSFLEGELGPFMGKMLELPSVEVDPEHPAA